LGGCKTRGATLPKLERATPLSCCPTWQIPISPSIEKKSFWKVTLCYSCVPYLFDRQLTECPRAGPYPRWAGVNACFPFAYHGCTRSLAGAKSFFTRMCRGIFLAGCKVSLQNLLFGATRGTFLASGCRMSLFWMQGVSFRLQGGTAARGVLWPSVLATMDPSSRI